MVYRSWAFAATHPTEKENEEGTQSENCEASNTEPHHHASSEGDFEAFTQTRPRCLGRADIGLGCDAHANVACECREHGTNDKCDYNEPVSRFNHGRYEAQQGACNDHENRKDAVLRTQECQCTFMNVLGDFAHSSFAGTLLAHPSGLNGHDNEAYDGQTWYEVKQ